MNNCRGFLFPGKGGFRHCYGRSAVSRQACYSLQGGGALDIIRDRETGILFNEQTSASLNEAIKLAEKQQWDHNLIMENAQRFDKNIFNDRLKNILDNSEDYKR